MTLILSQLTQKVGAVAVSRLAVALTALGTNMLFAWTLSKPENGMLQKVFIVTQVAILAGSFGIQTSLYYFLPRVEPHQKKSLVVQSGGILLALGLFCALLIFGFSSALAAAFRRPELAPLFQVAALSVLLTIPALISDPVWIAEDRAWMAAFTAANAGVFQLAAVAAVLLMKLPLHYVFLAIAGAAVIRLLPFLLYGYRLLPTGPAFSSNSALLRQQVVYILPVGLTAMVDTISAWLDRTLIAHYYDEASLATYTYGAIEIPLISLLIGSLTPVLLPEFSRLLKEGKRDEVLALWRRTTQKAAVILFGLFFLFMWAAPAFVVTLYSPRYHDSALYFRIYLLLLPVRIIAFMPMLFALGKQRQVMTGAVGEILLNLVVSVFLIRATPLGMAGAAIGTVISTVCQASYFLYHIGSGLGVTVARLLPWGALLRLFGKCALFFVPVALLLLVQLPPSVELLAALMYFAIYGWYHILPIFTPPAPPQNTLEQKVLL